MHIGSGFFQFSGEMFYLLCNNLLIPLDSFCFKVYLGLNGLSLLWGFPGGLGGKESVCNAGDPGSMPGSGRSPGEGNGCPLQYSCLGNPGDRGAWWATVHRVEKSQTQLSDQHTDTDILNPRCVLRK